MQVSRTGFEVPFPADPAILFTPGLLQPEIIQVCLAQAASHRFQVKTEIELLRAWKDFQQVTSQVLPRGATDPVPAPDFSQRVDTGITARDRFGYLAEQFGVLAQRGLDGGHPVGVECLIKEGLDLG
jgi:hypothetical protein